MSGKKPSIGIIGSGIAGLGCAYGLRDCAEVTLLDKNDYAGGHTNTRFVQESGRSLPIDTGFIVFNKVTYPHLTALFEELEVPIKSAEMSFAVRHDGDGMEYNGMGLDKVFAQRGNLFRPSFYRMLSDILRFFKIAPALLTDASSEGWTLGEFVERNRFGREFVDWYLVPMGAAVWSTPPSQMLQFPARSFVQFFQNHGFLGVKTHHPWFTVDGGAKTYVEKILEKAGKIQLRAEVRRVEEVSSGVKVRTASGEVLRFDKVILAGHADQSLEILERPDALQKELLGCFRYQKNHATLHCKPDFLPRRKKAWAAWNFLVRPDREENPATVHYWMNALQGVSDSKNYFVSLNCREEISDDEVLYETMYEHPVFTLDARKAQARLPELNDRAKSQRVYFCGSYFRHGFHEDAYGSAVALVGKIKAHLSPG